MVSTATSRLRLNKQATGDNTNTWGTVLNGQVFDLVDEALAGVETIAISANLTLSSTNFVSDQARNMGLIFTDGGLSAAPTVTIPSVEKLYFVVNDTGYTVTFDAGGATAAVETGRRKWIATDGTDVYAGEDGADLEYVDATFLKLAGGTLTGQVTAVGDPTADGHLARKKYVDDELMAVTTTAELPGQTGNAGKYLTTNGTVASWSTVDLTPYLTIANAATTYEPILTATTLGRQNLIDNPRFVTSADSPVTAANGDIIICDTSAGAITITMPAAAANLRIEIRAGASAATNNVTINPNGSDTLLGEASLQVDQAFWGWNFIGNSGAWA